MKSYKFTFNSFASVCAGTGNSVEQVKSKKQFDYLYGYLMSQKCESILVEEDYISKDFLDNYQFYYASCYQGYNKKCKRLHFFDRNIDGVFLDNLITTNGKNSDIFFKNHYLGFIVIRPIPEKIIGFSLLKTYKNLSVDKSFWGTRKYDVNILGIKYRFDSLAFQEQDGTLSACATTAIWASLSKSNYLNYTLLKTPNQITKDAGITSNSGGRLFPNKGLTINQVCNSLVRAGLETEVFTSQKPDVVKFIKEKKLTDPLSFSDAQEIFKLEKEKHIPPIQLKKVINAYSQLGIPIICAFQPSENEELHAIAINGFKKCEVNRTNIHEIKTFHYEAIETLYAHDDQWGPFCKIEFKSKKKFGIETVWSEKRIKNDNGETTEIVSNPKKNSRVLSLVIPIYKKVRVDFRDIEKAIIDIRQIYRSAFKFLNSNVTFDYFAINSNLFKENIRKTELVSNSEKVKFLRKSLPKYIWVIRIFKDENIFSDLILDATDVSSGMLGICKLSYGENFREINKFISKVVLVNKNSIVKNQKHSPIITKSLKTFIMSNNFYDYSHLSRLILEFQNDPKIVDSFDQNIEIVESVIEKADINESSNDSEVVSHLANFGILNDTVIAIAPWIPILWASFSVCKYSFQKFKGKPSSKWTSKEKDTFKQLLVNELTEKKVENAESIANSVISDIDFK